MTLENTALLDVESLGYAVDNQAILHNVSLKMMPGEFIGLVGPNGAGKSTLLKVISGLWTGFRGEVSLSGKPLRAYAPREVARIIAQVPQITAIEFPFTVQQIVLMGRNPHLSRFQLETEHDRQLVARAMQRTGSTAMAERLIGTLSGGERQLVLIARALAQEPRLLLLDEPTANLDIQHQVKLLTLVRGLVREDGLSAIAAVHDLELAARFCDKLVLLHQGQVLTQGSPHEVLESEHLRAAYGVDVRPYPDPITGYLRLAVLDTDDAQ